MASRWTWCSSRSAERFGFPLALFTYPDSPVKSSQLNDALYQVTVSGSQSAAGTVLAPATVSFRYAANGLDVVKTSTSTRTTWWASIRR